LWIGDHSAPEFRPVYEFCVASVAQLALRADLQQALARPAAHVRCVVLARMTRQAIDPLHQQRLAETYPQASIRCLLGPLCEGMRNPAAPPSGSTTAVSMHGVSMHEVSMYSHRWNQWLPQWLVPCGHTTNAPAEPCRSVAVLASTLTQADPLLELAESAGATAVWCRSADSLRVRNISAVWWDDSVARSTSQRGWVARMESFGGRRLGTEPSHVGRRRCLHAWIVNAPRQYEQSAAIGAGIDLVLSKPYRNDLLLAMLDTTRAAMPRSAAPLDIMAA
jgi:hypothetical protein